MDERRFAFVRDTQANVMADIFVMQTDGKLVREILFRPAEENLSGMWYVEKLAWISNQRLAASGSVNPSTGEYAVIDVETGKEVARYLVDGRVWAASPDGMHAAYVGSQPRFTPDEKRRPQFCIDDECGLFKPSPYRGGDVHLEFTSKPLWSDDSKAVAIIAEEYETKTERVIVRPLGGKPVVFVAPPGLDGNLVAGWEGKAMVIRAAKRVWRLEPGASALVAQKPI